MEPSLKLDQSEGVALVTLNRPRSYNSFDLDMIGRFAEMLTQLTSDPKVAGVVISGKGKVFCAGGDLKWAGSYAEHYGASFHELASRYHQAIVELRRMPKPAVAAVNGLAAGGGFSLALACDFRVMESTAVLRQAYTSNGLSIDGGGTFTLPRLVGLAKALEIAAFDRPIDSETALAWGLVTEVVEAGNSVHRAVELIHELKKASATSFAASKKLLTDSFDTPFEVQLEKERDFLSWCADQPNGREGIEAFAEKRAPVFNPST